MKNLLETAIEAGNFKTLVKAVQEAGLADILSRDGPFTIFAPTDEAFSKLPKKTLEYILKDKEKLTNILTYHVIPNKFMANDVLGLKNADTINGKQLFINTTEGVKINKARLIKTDIECTNGVIHIIDEVLIPK